MLVERWDAVRGKWIMYDKAKDHSADCARYPFEQIPARVFLDTNIVNLIIKYAPVIFEMERPNPATPLNRSRDVEALMHVFAVGARANWTLRASAKTLEEVNRTLCETTRGSLSSYVLEMLEFATEESRHGDDLGRRVAGSAFLNALPDRSDRELLGNAIGLGCDAFVTADVRTIVSKRDRLPELPLRILTPTEWWSHVKPWGGLWL
ncbi:hypothetical protein [Phreatobacter sp.]|uniref:hypothetical protein n=1 Tax=Phreatobacter sp. TaxID=1966341 RepID=UPI0025F20877|nr:MULTISPECIES: hypothetical protein [Hyphomicrobiales]